VTAVRGGSCGLAVHLRRARDHVDRHVAEGLDSSSTRFRAPTGESPVAYRDRWAARGGAHVPGCLLSTLGWPRPGHRPELAKGGQDGVLLGSTA
jgi:hypothetical protein